MPKSGNGKVIQLVAEGSQLSYLTGNPQITYFKSVYRRHTNFCTEYIKQVWNGNNLSYEGEFKCVISKTGDLLSRLYLEQTLEVEQNIESIAKLFKYKCDLCEDKNEVEDEEQKDEEDDEGNDDEVEENDILDENGYCKNNIRNNGGVFVYNPTHTAIDYVEIEIKGQSIDKHTGKWMEVYSQLTESNSAGMLGIVETNTGTKFQNMAKSGGTIVTGLGKFMDKYSNNTINQFLYNLKNDKKYLGDDNIKTKFDAYVPLRFWFCRNSGSAIPLISLDKSDVVLRMKFKNDALNINSLREYGSQIKIIKNNLYAQFVFLDKDERRRFYNSQHEYVFEQVQTTIINNQRSVLDLNFHNSVKEIIWTAGQHDRTGLFGLLPGGSTDYQENDYYKKNNNVNYKIIMNGIDRFTERKLEYFTKQQIYDYHKGTPVGTGKSYVNSICSCCSSDLEYAISARCNKCYNTRGNKTRVKQKGKKYYKKCKSPWDAVLTQLSYGQASNDTIAVYSFALKPEESQPSGTCNFSRLDNVTLNISNTPIDNILDNCFIEYDIYAISYNILKIKKGYCSLAYSL